MDVARALYFDLTGQPVASGVAREGRKWVVEDIDFVSSIRYLLKRELGLRELMRSYSGADESAFFAWDDPLPFFMMFANTVGKLLSHTKAENGRRNPWKLHRGRGQSCVVRDMKRT